MDLPLLPLFLALEQAWAGERAQEREQDRQECPEQLCVQSLLTHHGHADQYRFLQE
jgi:hypothetical protein